MKKAIVALLAAALVFGFVGPAAAAIDVGNLVVVTYDADVEVVTDLGPVADFGSATDLYNTDLSVFTTATTFAELNVGAFATSVTGSMLENYDIYFMVQSGATPVINSSQVYAAVSADFYANAQPTQATGFSKSYTNTKNAGGNSPGNYGGILTNYSIGEINLAALDAGIGSTVEFDIVHFYSTDWGTTLNDGGVVASYAYGIDAAGDVYVAPVPVPAAAWLLGSGLLGLIGIRRRNA